MRRGIGGEFEMENFAPFFVVNMNLDSDSYVSLIMSLIFDRNMVA